VVFGVIGQAFSMPKIARQTQFLSTLMPWRSCCCSPPSRALLAILRPAQPLQVVRPHRIALLFMVPFSQIVRMVAPILAWVEGLKSVKMLHPQPFLRRRLCSAQQLPIMAKWVAVMGLKPMKCLLINVALAIVPPTSVNSFLFVMHRDLKLI
jgi:hypothetical protein